MLKLKDIPQTVLEKCIKTKKLYDHTIIKAFQGNENILNSLNEQYGLSITDIGKHIKLNLEFCEHKCKTCGKTLHWSSSVSKFPEYCNTSCMAKNPDVVYKRKITFNRKYGGNAPICSEDVKRRIRETNIQKYGVVNPLSNEDIKAKIEANNIAKYGCKHAASSSSTIAKRKLTNQRKYGGNAPICSDEIKNRIKETNIKKYGAANPFQTDQIKEKIKQNTYEKYGVQHVSQLSTFKNKVKATCIDRYGCQCSLLNPQVHQKSIETCIEKYGVDNPLKSPIIRSKIEHTCNERYGYKTCLLNPEYKEEIKNTNFKKYGNAFAVASEEIKEKAKNTLINRYGVDNAFKSRAIRQKINRTIYDKTYDKLLSMCTTVIPNFTKSEFTGNPKKEYEWKCLECGRVFKDNYVYTSIPICRHCHPHRTSTGQEELLNFIETELENKIEVRSNLMSIIKPYELDIYIPDLKLAFEFNGTYWHSEEKGKDKNYHLNKTKLCEEKGIHLIHIFEWEWIFKKDLVKQRIKNILGSNRSDKIFARKCVVKEIASNTANDFVEKYHLQGISNASVNLGLFYKDELVSVMTFAKPRFNKQYQWELIRFCSKYPIIGGAGKLLVYFERKYKPISLISYANRCWSSKLSNVYEKIGFKLIGESEPNYVWYKGDMRLSRYQCQKHKLKNLLGDGNFDEELSETNNMLKNGFKKVFDCGNLVFSKVYYRI